MTSKVSAICVAAAAALTLVACASGTPAQAPNEATAKVGAAPLSGDTSAGNYLAGRFAQDSHDLAAAAAFLHSAERENPDDIELMQRAHMALAEEGRLSESADIARRVLKFDSDAAIAASIVAEQEAKAGHWDKAKAQIEALPRRGYNTILTPLIVAWSEVGMGHTDKALAALQPLESEAHQPALYNYHAALICDMADRRADAEKYYRAAMSAESGQVLRTIQMASSFFRRTGAPQAASDIVHRYRLEHGDATVVDLDATEHPIDSARAGLAEALFALAGAFRQGHAADLALVFSRLTLDLKPDFALAQMQTADALADMGRIDAADEVYLAIDANAPAHWDAQLRVANDYDTVHRVDDAMHILEAASQSHPNRPEALITLGDILRHHSRWGEAIAAYDRALTVIGTPRQQDWALLYARGISEESANQWPRAEADFLQALRLEPDQADVLNYLGYSWIERGENIDRATKMIEKALAQRPTDGFIVDSLGWTLFRTGQYDKAVAELEHAIELTPEDATINSHLGDALSAVGRSEEAKFQWQRALIFNPEADLKTELQKKLKDGFVPPTPLHSTKSTASD